MNRAYINKNNKYQIEALGKKHEYAFLETAIIYISNLKDLTETERLNMIRDLAMDGLCDVRRD